ncbi:glycerol-3-phosphate 1-O-acyltransferase PlsY [Methylobacillus flagellatus]|uniref:Glycerol-3-phosphate acyltransferase n=1 Tax=Methylobacillus flagellatus (strain ATCC 51484 / DSM 6875 / VKM B-1610 / KT) TaxID=265072 RepID=PLSY_METFK|nr:glycerol-3-phosphate 1-O-acyltransferase PlsY [Methylobacillus flagellatus]Q1GYU3.1 RecName: Full=Glycerol-3-phosphate acyltransferase; AltName: Full=Acyl-PO4 G3P acyltransferase; AltName: Full=Acyl-phosphate--glycerol-3-phosphate acyltransferase; AltName: Full=G3P acyltransferase; Short=GPAT; AltName: Full=Lysophosphatidic acid synthase; Short=LPA synthase [Methylobacillus flagellatus KT]ABE50594.1 acyl-phosphate glycerol-3-phosphate acyltransferase [Methylobacillus flagellatus KT]
MNNAVFVIAAYLLGSISFGILVSKAFGLPDPRTVGSGNPGATNVLRSGKKLAALLTLLGDAAKGWLPVWLAQYYALPVGVVCWVAVAVFLGHLYPVFYRFKGGKGVATALGVLLAFSPLLAGLALLSWIVVFALTRFSSLAALTAAALAPGFAWLLLPQIGYIIVVFVLSLLLIWRHRSNIRKLLDGSEAGFGKKS